MAILEGEFSVHATTTPGEVDVITLSFAETLPTQPSIRITNRGDAGELYFDFTYPGEFAPSTEITPAAPNTFVVLPGQTWEMHPVAQVPSDFVVVADSAVPYSVMAYA